MEHLENIKVSLIVYQKMLNKKNVHPYTIKIYTWLTLHEGMHHIMKTEKNEMYTLIFSLYIDQPPQCTEDFRNFNIH